MHGVGTRLITSEGQPALGAVYKLTAVQDGAGAWQPALKLSESPSKTPIAGPKSAWRLYDRRGLATADVLARADEVPFADGAPMVLHDPSLPGVRRTLAASEVSEVERLLDLAFADGAPTGPASSLDELRHRRIADVDRLDPGVRRLVNPHRYHVSLSDALHRLQTETVERLRAGAGS